jgi:outer membrane lipoprotein-sorting protein
MAQTRKSWSRRLACWCLLLVLAAPGAARGAEFSALMLVKDDAKTMPGKIYVSGGKMRQEFVDETGQTITIVRPDLKVVWVILPRRQSYLEVPLQTRLPGQFIQIPPQALGKRLVGQERLNGYDAEKYEVNVPIGRGLEKQTFWVAKKLGLPIKMECRERHFSLEYKSIKEEKIPDRRFALPPGLQKLSSIGGFADKVED